MFGPLHNHTEAQLLDYLRIILSKPGAMNARDATEIEQIEQEFAYREASSAWPVNGESDTEMNRRLRQASNTNHD